MRLRVCASTLQYSQSRHSNCILLAVVLPYSDMRNFLLLALSCILTILTYVQGTLTSYFIRTSTILLIPSCPTFLSDFHIFHLLKILYPRILGDLRFLLPLQSIWKVHNSLLIETWIFYAHLLTPFPKHKSSSQLLRIFRLSSACELGCSLSLLTPNQRLT